jgi:hypothetical protein
MYLGVLVLITALTISGVAIYYSIAGLVAIFAAAALPIMIMGGALEIGKLVTAVWLHRYWRQAVWWLKTYLTVAVVVLMFITSMGIFGFLSKAHIEQTSAGQESVAQVQRIEGEIERQQDIIVRAEQKIQKLETSNIGGDANIQAQIDAEQDRIDKAYERIQPAIDEQQKIIDSQATLYINELAKIDADMATLQGYIDSGETAKAQQMIGASADGIFGKKTADKIGDWQEQKQAERIELIEKIEQATNNPQAQTAAAEIKRLRTTAESQIAQSNELINRLRNQLGDTDKTESIDQEVDEQNLRIKNANDQIDTLIAEKYTIEGEYRKLEAEVGPIKYIAEFVYGEDADKNMLEEAVRWVIIVIIFVFDPLAVLLLIASQYTFDFHRRSKDDSGERLRQWQDYEQARAQRIVDNPGYNTDDPAPTQEKEEVDERVDEPTDSDIQDVDVEHNERDREADDEESLPGRSDVEPNEEQVSNSDQTQEGTSTEQDTGGSATASEEVEVQPDEVQPKETEVKIDPEADEEIHIETEEQRQRKEYIEEQELRDDIKTLKQQWKAEHPNENLKMYKKLYIHGRINSLPWIPEEGYVQNAEQSNDSIWKEIRDK